MSTVIRTSDHSMQISNGPNRSTLNITSTNGKVSVNITGPRGGNQQALIVDADAILTVLVELDMIPDKAAWNYVRRITDGCCICGNEIPLHDVVCDECFETAKRQR